LAARVDAEGAGAGTGCACAAVAKATRAAPASEHVRVMTFCTFDLDVTAGAEARRGRCN
jgi:hypothetical protein